MLRFIGFYKELRPHDGGVYRDSIHDFRREVGLYDEEKISRYLKEGVPVLHIMGGSPDIVSGDGERAGGASILTDGNWVWRMDLKYYLDKYHVLLDDEFVQHIRKRGYPLPTVGNSKLLRIIDEVNAALGFEVKEVPPMPPWNPAGR
jgi:hypothetical protein